MLKKMRWRLIRAAMAAFSAVMLILAAVILLGSYLVTVNRQEKIIAGIYEAEQRPGQKADDRRFPVFDHPGRPQPEFEHTTRFFMVYVDQEGEVVRVSRDFVSSVTDEEARTYGKTILKKKKKAGYYNRFRYRIFDTENGQLLIFLNSDMEYQFLENLCFITILVVLAGLLVLFPLIYLLSQRALLPYIRNMERQKRFITDAGHELKTPITSISASADVLAMLHGEDEWTENIQKQTSRMTKLVSNLITLSRLDEEVPFPNQEEFSLSDAAWEVAEPFETMAAAQGKHYSQNIAEGITLKGDRTSICQMISVLLDNAVKYSDENGEICFEVYEKHGKTYIEVTNTCQIENISDIDHFFDRFYRPDTSRSRKTGGSGIGLSIARATAEAHGGRISAKSRDGKKIRFQIIF